jgi:hypothetical protein
VNRNFGEPDDLPKIGDYKIKWEIKKAEGEASVVAK